MMDCDCPCLPVLQQHGMLLYAYSTTIFFFDLASQYRLDPLCTFSSFRQPLEPIPSRATSANLFDAVDPITIAPGITD